MARRRQREKHRAPKPRVKVSNGPKVPKGKPVVNEDKPPVMINKKAEQQTVKVKLHDVTQVEHECPGCKVTIKVIASDKVAAALRGMRPVAVACGACGQPMRLEYEGKGRILLARGL